MAKEVALKGDKYSCPCPKHGGGGTIKTGEENVLINGTPIATVGAICQCKGGQPDIIITGVNNIQINGKPIAATSSKTSHLGSVKGNSKLIIIE